MAEIGGSDGASVGSDRFMEWEESAAPGSPSAANEAERLLGPGDKRRQQPLERATPPKKSDTLAEDDVAMPVIDGSDSAEPLEAASTIAQPAGGGLSDATDSSASTGDPDLLTSALVDRLVAMLIGCSSPPAAATLPPLVSKVRHGLIKPVCNAVDIVWSTRRAELPKLSGLRHQARAWLAAAAAGDAPVSPEKAESLGKSMQARLRALEAEAKKERTSVYDSSRAATKSVGNGLKECDLPEALDAIQKASEARISASLEAVYLPYYNHGFPQHDANAVAAPPRSFPLSPPRAALDAAAAVSAAADPSASQVSQAKMSAAAPAEVATEAATSCATHRTRAAIPDVDGYDTGWQQCKDECLRKNLFLGPAVADARLMQKQSEQREQEARQESAKQVEEAQKHAFIDGQLSMLRRVESMLQGVLERHGEVGHDEFVGVDIGSVLTWVSKEEQKVYENSEELWKQVQVPAGDSVQDRIALLYQQHVMQADRFFEGACSFGP